MMAPAPPIRCTLVAAVFLLPALAPAPGWAQQSMGLTEAHRQGKALYEAGKYREAIPFFQKTLELAEKEFSPAHVNTAAYLNGSSTFGVDLGLVIDAGNRRSDGSNPRTGNALSRPKPSKAVAEGQPLQGVARAGP